MARHIRTWRGLVHPCDDSVLRGNYPQDFGSTVPRRHQMCCRGRANCHTLRGMKTKRPSLHRTWHGVRMCKVGIASNPDSPQRLVTLPAAWDDAAAAALAALAPGAGPVALTAAAAAWFEPIAAAASAAGCETPLADRLHRLLLLRRGTPSAAVWALDA